MCRSLSLMTSRDLGGEGAAPFLHQRGCVKSVCESLLWTYMANRRCFCPSWKEEGTNSEIRRGRVQDVPHLIHIIWITSHVYLDMIVCPDSYNGERGTRDKKSSLSSVWRSCVRCRTQRSNDLLVGGRKGQWRGGSNPPQRGWLTCSSQECQLICLQTWHAAIEGPHVPSAPPSVAASSSLLFTFIYGLFSVCPCMTFNMHNKPFEI